MWKPTIALQMTAEQKRTLKSWVRAGTTPQRMVMRSKICLLAANEHSNNAIAKELKTPVQLLYSGENASRKKDFWDFLKTLHMAQVPSAWIPAKLKLL